MNDINQKSTLLNLKERSKRGLFNVVGSLSKTLFGTLNEEDAKELQNKIENLKENEGYLLELIKNQTLIVESTANIFNKTQHTIDREFVHVEKKLKRLHDVINSIKTNISVQNINIQLETLVSLTTLALIRFQTTQNTLIDLVTHVKHGKPHPSILTPNQAHILLTTIRKELPNTLALPVQAKSNNILQLYQLGEIRTAVLSDKILFELRLPLPFREHYQLFKVIPLPTSHNNNFVYIQPSSNYLVVDYNREHYYSMNKFDLSNCRTTDLEVYLCRITHPIFSIQSRNNLCEIELLKHSTRVVPNCITQIIPPANFWIQLSQPNKWLYSIVNSTTVDAVCGTNITPYKLSGTGNLEIKQGCYLRSEEMTIKSHNSKVTRVNNFYLPSLNLTLKVPPIYTPEPTNQSNTRTHLIKYFDDHELRELNLALKEQKRNENFKPTILNSHTIHHYVISYVLVGVVLIISCISIRRRIQKRKRPQPDNIIDNEGKRSSYTITIP